MELKGLIFGLVFITLKKTQTTEAYTGGDQFNNYYTNPNHIQEFLAQLDTPVDSACEEIKGIGQPILAIKKALQTVDTGLDTSNNDTNAKIIFFNRKTNKSTKQQTYKLVVQIKNFTSNNYLALEGIYKKIGFPTFEVTTYYVDSDIDNVRAVLDDYTIDPQNFVGCGNVKSIYSKANPVLPDPTTSIKGQQTDPSQTPYAKNNKLLNKKTGDTKSKTDTNSDTDPYTIAEIIKILKGS